MENLPFEVVMRVFECLPRRDRMQLGLTCQTLHGYSIHQSLHTRITVDVDQERMRLQRTRNAPSTIEERINLLSNKFNPNLKTLTWINVYTYNLDMLVGFLKSPSLQTLFIRCAGVHSGKLQEIFNLLPMLKNLSIRCSWLPVLSPISSLVHLKKLCLDDIEMPALRSLKVHGLKSLKVGIDRPDESLARIMDANKNSLVYLAIHYKTANGDQLKSLSELPVSLCLKLKFLAFKFSLNPHDCRQNMDKLKTSIMSVENVSICIRNHCRPDVFDNIVPSGLASDIVHNLHGLHVRAMVPYNALFTDPALTAACAHLSTVIICGMNIDVNDIYSSLFKMRLLRKLKLYDVKIIEPENHNEPFDFRELESEIKYLEFNHLKKGLKLDMPQLLVKMPRLVYARFYDTHDFVFGPLPPRPQNHVFPYLRMLQIHYRYRSISASVFKNLISMSPLISHIPPIADGLVVDIPWFAQPDLSADIELGKLPVSQHRTYPERLSDRIFRLDEQHFCD